MARSPSGSCHGCGGCTPKCPMPAAAPVPVCQPIPLRQITGDEAVFHNAHLLLTAYCVPFACADFHQRFLQKRVVLIACPNESGVDCTAQLSALLSNSSILTVTMVRMEKSCCDGLEAALRTALHSCDKFIPWRIVTLGADGQTAEAH